LYNCFIYEKCRTDWSVLSNICQYENYITIIIFGEEISWEHIANLRPTLRQRNIYILMWINAVSQHLLECVLVTVILILKEIEIVNYQYILFQKLSYLSFSLFCIDFKRATLDNVSWLSQTCLNPISVKNCLTLLN
jgi:hypothetical protein